VFLGSGLCRAGLVLKVDFDALYRSHYGRVFGLCLRLLRRPAQAEDAAQEVFVRAYRSLDRYNPDQPFAAWVSGIATHHCIDLIRRRAKEPGLFDDPDADLNALESDAPAPLDALVDAERGAAVRAAIAALPDKYRVPIVLAYFNDSSYDEIAADLGITRNHVGVLLLRGKHLLRQSLAAADTEHKQ
jgi:RNA polymerase sigma-70 factor, ECF subfamily